MFFLLTLLLLHGVVEPRNIAFTDNLGDVVYVNVLYRHGARTPDKTYKNDPHKHDFKIGLGELTNKGKMQHYELGKWLRQRYDHILTDTYSPDLLYVLSSDKDRVLMSAECNLAGMYPPKLDQRWNPLLDWQPIPVHTKPASKDRLIAMKENCSAYDQEFKKVLNSDELKAQRAKYQYVVDILNEHTGENRNDYKYISNMYDIFKVQNELGMPPPEWTRNIFPGPMKEAAILRFTLPTWNKKLARLQAGPLIGDMVRNLETKVQKGVKQVMHVYAGHDTTVSSFLNTLGVWDKDQPPYAACVLIELRRDVTGGHYVTLFYRTSAAEEPRLLTIPGCEAVCPLDKFFSLTKPLIPQDWDAECKDVK